MILNSLFGKSLICMNRLQKEMKKFSKKQPIQQISMNYLTFSFSTIRIYHSLVLKPKQNQPKVTIGF
jgi:hypothetical protein